MPLLGFDPSLPANLAVYLEFIRLACSHYTTEANLFGTQGEIRTHKTFFLREVCIPVPSQGHFIFGAGDRTRTCIGCLEGGWSASDPHPHKSLAPLKSPFYLAEEVRLELTHLFSEILGFQDRCR